MMQTNNHINIIKRFQGKRIAVVGDLMLDAYVWGKVSRISPEAPVPVVQVKKMTHSLGGASNVMSNISALGGSATAFGVVGSGNNGTILLDLMDKNGIDTENVIIDDNYLTIEKQRIIAEGQQVVRVDYENSGFVPEEMQERITESLISKIKNDEFDAIIFEDYAKGILTEGMIIDVINASREKNIYVALDPHPSNRLQTKGLSLMTPNQLEAFALAGIYNSELTEPVCEDPGLLEVARKLNDEWDVKQLLITLGQKGMILFEQGKEPIHIPTKAKEVFDVTGAGDTVIASYTLAIAAGGSGLEAAEISNHAAGIVVGRIGSSSITSEELVDLFSAECRK